MTTVSPLPPPTQPVADDAGRPDRVFYQWLLSADSAIRSVLSSALSGLAAIARSGSASDLIAGIVPLARLPTIPASGVSGLSAVATSGSASDVSGLGYFATGTDAANLTGTVNNSRLSSIPNTALANSSVTIAGHSVPLGGSQTLSASDVGLGSVTNDAQTKAAIVPNTAPTAGQILVGNGTAYAKQSISGDATLSSAGALTVSKTGGVSFGHFATNTDMESLTGSAWTTYTPTVTPGAGSLTSYTANGWYKQIGKVVFVRVKILITTNGTASSYLIFTLPVNAKTDTRFFNIGLNNLNGTTLLCYTDNANAAQADLFNLSGTTYPGGNGAELHITLWYEAA